MNKNQLRKKVEFKLKYSAIYLIWQKEKTLENWTAPQKLDTKFNDWGAFCMKLTYEDKLGIYKLRKQGVSWPQLGQTYDVNPRNLR